MLARWRRIHPFVYVSVGLTASGLVLEAAFHFVPPELIPAYAGWLAGLSAVDRSFFYSAYELIAHILVGLGLTGLVCWLLYRQFAESERQTSQKS